MYIPYQFKNLENKGIKVDTYSEPYFYEKFYYFYYIILSCKIINIINI